jgi:carbon-monoxide dehydrogenase large subunit
MTTERTTSGLIGASIRRVEDPVLVAGKGCYVDDIQLPGMLSLAFHRTTYPHARILSINTDAAKAMSGVQAVLTGADIEVEYPGGTGGVARKIPPHPCWRAAPCTKTVLPWLRWSRKTARSRKMLPAPSRSITKRCRRSQTRRRPSRRARREREEWTAISVTSRPKRRRCG